MTVSDSAPTPTTFPRLWCPLLTHYAPNGAIDTERMAAHLAHIRPFVRAFLIPGSTGDGWLLSDDEARTVLTFLLDALARDTTDHPCVLIGALRSTADEMCRFIGDTMEWLRERAIGARADAEVLRRNRVAGFTACPPTGEDMSAPSMLAALRLVLSLGLPTALYQLPQVTRNRMSPVMLAMLRSQFRNLVLFKDSSGEDTIAIHHSDARERVFMVRGAEGDYATWLSGPYDGLLLSTANCFAAELRTVVDGVTDRNAEDPDIVRLSDDLSGCVADAFAAVVGIGAPGNAFTHANKAIDHFMAHGPNTSLDSDALPVLHGGVRMPRNAVAAVGEALRKWGLMPAAGYLPPPR